uniref:UDP-GlcNAc:betaGal beta-1,3-N-acetylglucosaminyltransferase like 1 n=1 Tax=Macaca fascicularis TaxID=9541 RepID=A0A2K5V1B6_MACFA
LHRTIHTLDQPADARAAPDAGRPGGPVVLLRAPQEGRRRRPCGPEPPAVPIPPGHASVLETTIWTHRVRFLEEQALPRWAAFTIWNAGKQGRRLYRSLTAASQRKVVAFCDVDENKIRKGFYCHEDSQERPKPRIPILHFRAARPPFVICVKLDLTGGAFEDNLRSLHLQEGQDFLHFS